MGQDLQESVGGFLETHAAAANWGLYQKRNCLGVQIAGGQVKEMVKWPGGASGPQESPCCFSARPPGATKGCEPRGIRASDFPREAGSLVFMGNVLIFHMRAVNSFLKHHNAPVHVMCGLWG